MFGLSHVMVDPVSNVHVKLSNLHLDQTALFWVTSPVEPSMQLHGSFPDTLGHLFHNENVRLKPHGDIPEAAA